MGYFDSLNDSTGGLLGAIGHGLADNTGLLFGLAANGFAGANEGMQSDQNAQLLRQKQQERALKRQALLAYAKANGIDTGLAQDEDTLKMAIDARRHEELMKRQAAQDAWHRQSFWATYNKPTDITREMDEAGITDPAERKKIMTEHVNRTARGSSGYGLQGIPIEVPETDAAGNPVLDPDTGRPKMRPALGQLGADGTLVESKMPKGARVLSPYDKSAETAEGRATGAAQGSLVARAPQLIANGEKFDRNIEDMVKDPALKYITGLYSMGPILPNTAQASADARLKEVQGETFLQAYNELRGAGAINKAEGDKGEAAKARLQRAQKTEDFIAAARELQTIVRTATDRLRRVGGRGGGPVEDQGAFGGGSTAGPRLKSKYGLE